MKQLLLFLLIAFFPVSALPDHFSDVDKIRIILDKKQEKVFDYNHTHNSDRSFDASIQIGNENEILPIRAHIRGQGTRVRCDRKSFSLNLPDDTEHALFVGSGVTGVFLLSMCQDRLYLRTNTVYTLWRETGFFPFDFRLVELQINQQGRGLYMMLEKPVDALLESFPDLTAVLRRRFFQPDDVVEAKYSESSKNIAIGDYVNAFLDVGELADSEQVDALEAVLDVEQFLRHLAVAAAFRNGDYVDEVWFYRAPEKQREYQQSGGYRMIKWDPDDVLNICHHAGAYAWKDPVEIAYCAESTLSKAVLSNSILYSRFIVILDGLIERDLAPEKFNAAIDDTVALLIERINREEMVAVMEQFGTDRESEQAPVSLAEGHQEILREAAKLKQRYQGQIQALRSKIRKYNSN